MWDEVLDCEGVEVVSTYIEPWPREGRAPEKVLIIVVQPEAARRRRCPECGTRGKRVEADVRRWRTLDVHGKRTFIESEVPRIICAEHGKITAAVPWAAHAGRFTAVFALHAAWLAAQMPWAKAAKELRITWDAVESIVTRVAADAASRRDRLAGLRRIGIDEKSWGKGEDKYLMVVTDHDRGTIAWIAGGRCQETVGEFFDALGPERSKLLTHVSADGAEWIHDVVREKAPQAKICLDAFYAFHVVKWAGERLDELRRRLAGELRAAGRGDEAATLGTGMRALRKDERKLTPAQRGTLAQIAVVNKPLYKGYLIKEQIREAFKVKGDQGKTLMRGVTAWAHRCRIPEFTKLAKTLSRYKDSIVATLGGGSVERPRRSPQRPDQRPHHPGPGLPQRRRPHGHGRVRLRRPMPRITLLT